MTAGCLSDDGHVTRRCCVARREREITSTTIVDNDDSRQ